MKCSQNELASLIKKAAMGKGYPEGLAKEIALGALALPTHNAEAALSSLTREGVWCVARNGPALFDSALMALSGQSTKLFERVLIGVDCLEMLQGMALVAEYNFGLETTIDSRETETHLSITLNAASSSKPKVLGAIDVPDDVYKALDAFAQKTYVPATDASRLKGAGAGLTDND